MANKEYRPEKWIGQPDWCPNCLGHQDGQCPKCVASFEAGASAMLKANNKYLSEATGWDNLDARMQEMKQ